MRRLAAMRSAGERKLLIAEAITIRRALLQQWQSLKDFDRRTREDRLRHVAKGQRQFSIGAGNGDSAAVAALHQRSPRHFDENRISHVALSANLPRFVSASIEPQRNGRGKAVRNDWQGLKQNGCANLRRDGDVGRRGRRAKMRLDILRLVKLLLDLPDDVP
jgi:hypothetical protein